jgi:hypothetical protein
MQVNRKLAFIGIGCAALIVVALAAREMSKPRTYEECMVEEMRGQAAPMMHTVDKVCSRRFDREFVIDRSLTNWSFDGSSSVDIKVHDLSSEYLFTRGQFSFSGKPCDESKQEDFRFEWNEIVRKDGDFHMLYNTLDLPPPKCMLTKRLWGKFK